MSNDSIIIHCHLLKEAREDLNLSLEDVARHLTLNVKHITSMEENKKDGFVSPSIKLISVRKYIAFLELDIDTVIEHKKNKAKSLLLAEPEIEKDVDMGEHPSNKQILFLSSKIKLFFLWAKTHIRVRYIFYFITFLFISNFLIGVYQKYAVAHKNFEGREVDLPNIESLPIQIKKSEENKRETKDVAIKMCGQTVSKPLTQISSPTDPLKPSDYFHIISKGQQTICILDSQGKEDKYLMTEGQKLTYRGGKAPFKLLINPELSEIFYEGWLVKLKLDQSYIQLNPKTYN
ncbi:Cro/C1-type helix-turn-helix domain [Candidatus Methylopumilus universalis]|uniref:helix-turn-helix domain-containing protein n=1 Tax=Candidatus Methylopumilus universalis TaxID=2588536 RepID=UPI003BEEE2E3